MYSRSPSRNNRSRGIKVKHILQICLLVAVCFWLIYQVKHSHEKKKEFEEKDANLASETQSGELLKLGRKDIPRVTDTGAYDKLHGEDDEEDEEEIKHEENEADEEGNRHEENEADEVENRQEEDEDEEENTHEENEQEREEIRIENREDEEDTGKGGDDEEIDKHEEEKLDDDHEGFVDEATEREEGDEKNENNDDGQKEDKEESEAVSEDRDHEGGDRNTHEAREEHYKADDASSEVAHDTSTVIPDNENATVKHTELLTDGKENVSQISNQLPLEENSGPQMKEREATDGVNSSYSRVTESKEYKDNLTMSESGNSTTLRESIDQSQASSNLTLFESEHSTNMTQAQNATYEDGHNEGSNTPVSLYSHTNTSDSDKNQLDIKTVTNFTQPVNATSEGSLGSSSEVKLALSENVTDARETKADKVNSANAGTNSSPPRNSENNVTAGENEISISDTANDNTGADLHDPVHDFDSSLTQEEKEYRTDLGTLPDIKLEVQHADDVEAE